MKIASFDRYVYGFLWTGSNAVVYYNSSAITFQREKATGQTAPLSIACKKETDMALFLERSGKHENTHRNSCQSDGTYGMMN
jgi:hypothetical protein